ncbi:MAG TPA: DUF5668 domain-containing protein [Terriglobia bacterium]|nr:DUF5668 domain-containing protein [Terriglobia bacterium]
MAQHYDALTTNPGKFESKQTRFYRGLTWPVLLITLGLMLLAEQFLPNWGFSKTWPVLLIVVGVLKLIESGRPPRPPEGPRL